MDTDIALARLAAGRTVPIGAECGCGVHDGPPGVVWKHAKRSIFGPPFSLQVSCTTVKCRATASDACNRLPIIVAILIKAWRESGPAFPGWPRRQSWLTPP